MKLVSRRGFVGLAGSLGLMGAGVLVGCAGGSPSSGAASASSSAVSAESLASGEPEALDGLGEAYSRNFTVGTLATEDILPYWVALEERLFPEHNLNVDIVTFQSATELIAGVSSGEVDLAMTDIMVAASMYAGGTDIRMSWVTLGETPEQGRFGIMVNEDSPVRKLDELAGVPIGVGSNTILEYVMDKLMEQAGVPSDQVLVEELQKLPVRYQAMQSGQVAAAALPGSLLALGEASGCRTIADDTSGENISQSVMVVQSSIYDDAERAALVEELQAVWDEAARLINDDPEKYRSVLVANANLSDAVAEAYPISTYPACKLPSGDMVAPVLEWMQQKGYLSKPLSYDESTGAFS